MESPLDAVSVVIVSYDTRDALRDCLKSLPAGVRALVVDNASPDGSGAMVRAEFPHVALAQSYVNRGFGRAANSALEYCETEFALILNADIQIREGSIECLVDFMHAHPQAVACGGKLVGRFGSLQYSCADRLTLRAVLFEQLGLDKLFRKNPLFGRYWMSTWDHSEDRPVEQIMGACLMLRRAGDTFPLFDPRFFLYCEDTELCYRLRKRGEIWYVHGAVFSHALGASGKGKRWQMVSLYNRGKELFFLIHQRWLSAFTCRALNLIGATLRLPLKPRVFWEVWRDMWALPIGFQPGEGGAPAPPKA